MHSGGVGFCRDQVFWPLSWVLYFRAMSTFAEAGSKATALVA